MPMRTKTILGNNNMQCTHSGPRCRREGHLAVQSPQRQPSSVVQIPPQLVSDEHPEVIEAFRQHNEINRQREAEGEQHQRRVLGRRSSGGGGWLGVAGDRSRFFFEARVEQPVRG